MPVIRIQREELKRFGLSADALINNVRMLGADLKDVGDEEILVEFFPDRPDLYTVEGVVRALKGILQIETGAPKYVLNESDIIVNVDRSVENVRPYIVCALVKNINIDDTTIKSMMDFQEKLHLTVGRKRKKLAIGLHDADKVQPPFTYTTESPDFEFVPLGFDEPMSLNDILIKHPKGIEYGEILKGKKKYPIIIDKNGHVLSFPPIINGMFTEITPHTKNIFIDITGTDLNVLKGVLNILVTAFADRGADVHAVKIVYPDQVIITPELKYEKINVSKDYITKILGKKLSNKEITMALNKLRFDVTIYGDYVEAVVPPYRMDILHPIDIVEDIAKGLGYDYFSTVLPNKQVFGKTFVENYEKMRDIMVSLGFQEIITLTITSFDRMYKKCMIDGENYVEIENPITEDGTTLRSWLIPSILEIMNKNKHRELPQKIFEVGYVQTDTKEMHLSFGVIDSKASFTVAKSIAEAILRNFGIENYIVREIIHPTFINGRCAEIIIESEEIGYFGEIHPAVLENYELGYPVAAGEINLEKFFKHTNSKLK